MRLPTHETPVDLNNRGFLSRIAPHTIKTAATSKPPAAMIRRLSAMILLSLYRLMLIFLRFSLRTHTRCVFRGKPAADSERNRPLIPEQTGHRFRRQTGHFFLNRRNGRPVCRNARPVYRNPSIQ